MNGLRTTLVTVLALSAVSATFAQGMRTATGQNPLERISGSGYEAVALGRTNVAPSYSSRYGLHHVTGGSDSRGYSWTQPRNGNGVDPRTGQVYTDNRNNPFLYPYVRTPGGQLGGGVNPQAPVSGNAIGNTVMPAGQSNLTAAASGIYAGMNNGAYATTTMGGYYAGGGLNSMAYPAGLPYIQNGRSITGFGGQSNAMTNGQAYPFGMSSFGLGSVSANPYMSAGYGLGGVGAGAGVGGAYGGYGNTYPYSNQYGYGYGYTNVRMLVPGIAGAAVGALIGRHFGIVGLVAGGVGGFLAGTFLANQARQMPFSGLYDNYNAMVDTQYGNQYSYYHGLYDYYGYRSGSNLGPLPGVAGAVLGALVGKMGGLPGMLIGGVVGFLGGQLLSHVLMPQSQYQNGYYSYDPYNNINNFRNQTLPGSLGSATATPNASGGAVSLTPAAPVNDERLSALQAAYQSAFRAAQDAAANGTDAQRKQADVNLKAAEKAFRDAERAASGN